MGGVHLPQIGTIRFDPQPYQSWPSVRGAEHQITASRARSFCWSLLGSSLRHFAWRGGDAPGFGGLGTGDDAVGLVCAPVCSHQLIEEAGYSLRKPVPVGSVLLWG